MINFSKFFFTAVVVFNLVTGKEVVADPITLTDIAGREIQLETPVNKIVLGEGRQIYFLSILDKENPFQRVIGWRDEFPKVDPEIYAAYLETYPEIAHLPTFGNANTGTFSAEQIIALDPDILLMGVEQKTAMEEGGYADSLEKAGIVVAYVDFREIKNTERTMRLIGKITGKEDIAEEFITFRNKSIQYIVDRLKEANPPRPIVFIERAAGWFDECCMSYGDENFGLMVELAGGSNMAKDLIPGALGVVSPEQVIASDPQHIIATSSNWEAQVPGGPWIGVGYGADKKEARNKLDSLMQRPIFTGTAAFKDRNIHAIWHQFLANPYEFIAIEQMAKWLHPELFADLDPEATFAQLHERFLPLPYKSGYFVSLKD